MPKETRATTHVVSETSEQGARVPDGMKVGSEEHLNHVYRLFVRWSALPPSERKPPIVKEFMKIFDVTSKQIADFKEREGYYDELEEHARNWGRSKLPELIHKLYHQSKDSGRSQDIERFQKIVTDKKDDDNKGGDNYLTLVNPSDEQYRQIVERESKKYQDVEAEGNLLSPSSEDEAN